VKKYLIKIWNSTNLDLLGQLIWESDNVDKLILEVNQHIPKGSRATIEEKND